MSRFAVSRNTRIALALAVISLLSLILQLLIMLVPQDPLWGPDGGTYVGIASEISSPLDAFTSDAGDGGYWAIGYPLFLWALGLVAGGSLEAIVVAQSLMLIATAFITYALAEPFSTRNRVLVFALVALSPSLLFASRVIGYEVLLMLLLTASTLFLVRARRVFSPSAVGSALLAGLVLGMATWVQSKTLVLVPVFLLALIAVRPANARLLRLGLFSGPYAILVGLLALRNALAVGRFSPVTSNAAVNVWIGNSPESSGRYANIDFPDDWRETLFERVLAFASEQPREFLTLQVRKVVELFVPTRERPDWDMLGLDLSLEVIQFVWLAVLSLGLLLFIAGALFRVLGRVIDLWPLALVVVIGLGTHIPFIAEARMRIPYEPVLTVVAAAVLTILVGRWKSSPMPAYGTEELSGGRESQSTSVTP